MKLEKNILLDFFLKDDNKYLGCVHDKKEKKKGCSFTLDLIDGLKVIK